MKRSEIREAIFRLVFCGDFHKGDEISEQERLYFEDFEEASEDERQYMKEKFDRISSRIPELDEKINEVAKGWKTNRMGKTELAILRLAVYEMLFDESVPVKVAINEAVELAKKYGGDDSPAFVNGILAKLV